MADPQDNQAELPNPAEDLEILAVEEALRRYVDTHPDVVAARDTKDPRFAEIWQSVHNRMQPAVWDQYVVSKPDKAVRYATTHNPIQQALERQQARLQPQAAPPTPSGTPVQSTFGEFDQRAQRIQQGERPPPLGPPPPQAQPGSFSSFNQRAQDVQAAAKKKQEEAWTTQAAQQEAQAVLREAVKLEIAAKKRQGKAEARAAGIPAMEVKDTSSQPTTTQPPPQPTDQQPQIVEQNPPSAQSATAAQQKGTRTVLKTPSRTKRLARKGMGAVGLGFVGANLAGSLGDNPGNNQPQYKMYYGPDELSTLFRELPGLRGGAAEWSRLTQQYPELQGVADGQQFEEWRSEHPEIPSTAWDAREAYAKYSQYFPEGAESEREFQSQVVDQQKREGERLKQEEAQAKSERQQMWMHMQHLPQTPIISRFFLSSNIDQDRDFRKVVERPRQEHDSKNPRDKIQGKTFVQAKDGTILVSQNVLTAIPDIQEQAKGQFFREKPGIANRYKKQKRDFLTDHSRYNPELKAIHDRAERQARHVFLVEEAIYQRQRKHNPKAVAPDLDLIREGILLPALNKFLDNPKNRALARAYKMDSHLQHVLKQRDDAEALTRLTTQFHNDPEVQAVLKDIEQQVQIKVAEERRKKSRDPKYTERTEIQIREEVENRVLPRYFSKNPDKAAEYAKYNLGITRSYLKWLGAQQQAGSTPHQQTQAAGTAAAGKTAPQGGPTVTPGLHALSSSGSTQQAASPSQAVRFPQSSWARPSGGGTSNTPSQAANAGGPPNRRGRVRNPLGSARPPGGQAEKVAEKLIKRGLFAFFRTPPGMAVLAIIFVVILFLQLLSPAGLSQGTVESEETDATVTVTKTGDAAIGNSETITYTLTVNPTGTAADIQVIDEIPDNAEFVSANPQPTERAGNRLVWLLSALGNSSDSNQSTNPSQQRPSARGTIHNLGLAEVNGAQMDALIKRIQPQSPMVGSGAKIVQYAREFSVDPLLIFIAINESQMCSDDGVVSPGGSDPPDPDNYNCAGITWGAVDGVNGDGVLSQTELDRWSAKEGPIANNRPFTFVPTVEDGIGLFFNYVGVHPRYEGRTPQQFYDIYNPCADLDNQGRFACGAEEMDNILARVRGALQATGVNASSLQAAATFSPTTIMVILKPKEGVEDTHIINRAFAEVVQ